MNKSQIQILFNVRGKNPEQVKQDFHDTCLSEGKDMTEVLNQFIREYTKAHK